MINGRKYDWDSLEIVLPIGLTIGLTDISYDEERPVEPRYGKGSKPRGFGTKNYKCSGSMTLDRDDGDRLRLSLGGSFLGNYPPFPIILKYGNDDMPVTVDTLPACKITKVGASAKQEDENAGVYKLDFVCLSEVRRI